MPVVCMSPRSLFTHLICRFAAIGGIIMCLSACGQKPSFRCGISPDNNNQSATRCSRNLEVCVCENNYCAREVSTSECVSGLKYVEAPFVPDDVANTCVAGLLHPTWMVRSDPASNQLPLCASSTPDSGTGRDMSSAL